MGYYTDYELTVKEYPKNINESEFNKLIEEYIRYNKNMNWMGSWCGTWYGNAKWYESDSDMRAMSKVFPDAVFQLEGVGEEAGDLWKAWYKSGKMQFTKAQIIYDEYDPDHFR